MFFKYLIYSLTTLEIVPWHRSVSPQLCVMFQRY